MKKYFFMLLFLFSTALGAEETMALAEEPTQSVEALRNTIEEYVSKELSTYAEGRVQVSADKIDSRLQLKPCDKAQLKVFNPYQTTLLNTSTMGIQCREKTNHWTLYVPIRVTVLKPVLLAKRPLIRGTKVTVDDLYQAEVDVQQLKQGYFTDQEAIVGQVCKQNIAASTPFNSYNLELAKLVLKGEQVRIIAKEGNLSISMDGVALDDGALGEPVKVKNLSSKRILEARVAGNKKVQVVM